MAIQIMDTHEVIGTLTAEYDLDLKQAEGVVYAVRQGNQSAIEGLATKKALSDTKTDLKQDIAEVKTDLKQDIAEVKTELKQDIAEVKAELKQDIAEVKTELKKDIAEVKAELKQDIAEVRQDIARIDGSMKILLWMLPIGFSLMTIVMAAVLKLL
ncbi:MAG: apolipoprotein A1/A4/E family protein [Candidatus Portiera sp.]|nr:apolipoprotein A1/A4/E family protein [Portiera sp.]